MYDILELNQKLLAELRDIAKGLKIKRVESFKKQDLIYKILDAQAIVVSESKTAKKEGGRIEGPKKATSVNETEDKEATAKVSAEVKTSQRRKPGRPKKSRKPFKEEADAGMKVAETTASAVPGPSASPSPAAKPENEPAPEQGSRNQPQGDRQPRRDSSRKGERKFTPSAI